MFWFIHGIFHLDVRVFDGIYWSIARKFIFDTLEVNGATSNNTTTNQQDNYRIGKKYWKYVKSRERETVGYQH
jgi:hypothetical protein